jgi:hypothetical protein
MENKILPLNHDKYPKWGVHQPQLSSKLIHTLTPYSLIAVWFGKFNILPASTREIFSYAFSRHAAISLRIVSKRISMKKL